jgi:hypothetical protein
MVELADIRQRIFERKEEIRISTHHIIDMAVDYESIDSEDNIKQIKKEINNIMSCLTELKPYASLFGKYKVSKIQNGGIRIIALLGVGLATPILLDVFCVAVNSIEVKPTKKSVKTVVGVNLRGLKLLRSKEESNF